VNEIAGSRAIAARLVGLAEPGEREIERKVAVETPIALEYSGIGYAVMMATPIDIEDFIIGHALAEGPNSRKSKVSTGRQVPFMPRPTADRTDGLFASAKMSGGTMPSTS